MHVYQIMAIACKKTGWLADPTAQSLLIQLDSLYNTTTK